MSVYVRGGHWTPAEDQVLIAAVQKYGLNQWDRISSLLARHNVRQCRARWVEWLDPNLSKEEWSQEEDETLLTLAQRLPNMWRTIAPMLKRPAQQCVDRYTYLLGASTAESDGADESKASVEPEDDESRAATAEMLTEARARLANSLGRKAKRKLREKLEDQKRRDEEFERHRSEGAPLVQKTSKFGINYNNAVPFVAPVPAGAFDTAEDDTRDATVRKTLVQDISKAPLNIGSQDSGIKRVAESQKETPATRRRLVLPPPARQSMPKLPKPTPKMREEVRRALLSIPPPRPDLGLSVGLVEARETPDIDAEHGNDAGHDTGHGVGHVNIHSTHDTPRNTTQDNDTSYDTTLREHHPPDSQSTDTFANAKALIDAEVNALMEPAVNGVRLHPKLPDRPSISLTDGSTILNAQILTQLHYLRAQIQSPYKSCQSLQAKIGEAAKECLELEHQANLP